ncbi:MAG: hypothetical protein M3Z09_04150 [Acidobacteriota bacterium]|nr:hypothetical protein [Acidobacteriota bacterium]
MRLNTSPRWNLGRAEKVCEMRETTVACVSQLVVDALQNGGVSVKGWDGKAVLVRAKVDAWNKTLNEARSIVSRIEIQTRDGVGATSFSVENGGVVLSRLKGSVHGNSMNGTIMIQLAGNRWEGSGMDVEATHGGILVDVPQAYSARLELEAPSRKINSQTPLGAQRSYMDRYAVRRKS